MYNNNIISYQAQLAYKLWKSDDMFCMFFSLITVDFSEIFTYTDIGTKLNDTVAVSNEDSFRDTVQSSYSSTLPRDQEQQ